MREISREQALYTQQLRTNDTITDRIIFPICYNKYNLQVCKIVKNNFYILSNDQLIGKTFEFKPMVAFKRERNLKDFLVRSKLNQNIVGCTRPCDRKKCVTCPHVSKNSKIVGPKGFIKIKSNFTCISEGLIYVIECNKCGSLYVGETGRKLGDRFREHRRNVINKKTDHEVANHFCQGDHSVDDMLISGVLFVRDILKRKLLEQKFISRLGCILGSGMNVDFKFQDLLEM